MPLRSTPLVNNEIYHVMNRGVGSIPIFTSRKDYARFLNTFDYYRSQKVPCSYSRFLERPLDERMTTLKNFKQHQNYLIEILAYCLMPTHFHFLLRQTLDQGIAKFIRLTSNSYSKYFNIKYNRHGSLFAGRFKVVRVATDEQLIHVSRYIHLNPYTGYVVSGLDELFNYPYSSLIEYAQDFNPKLGSTKFILNMFKNKNDYRKFITDHADFQRNLEKIKHLTLEEN